MKVLDHFSVPYQGLKNGMHTFHFQVDDTFFECFESALVKRGSFEVTLDIDKRPDMAVASFILEGEAEVTCDRCLGEFMLPLDTEFVLHIKYGTGDDSEDEVMFIDEDTHQVNFAQPIYEWICLSLPMVKAHEDVADCDPEVIQRLKDSGDDSDDNSPWSSLKDLHFE